MHLLNTVSIFTNYSFNKRFSPKQRFCCLVNLKQDQSSWSRVRLSVKDVLSGIVLLCVPQVLVVKNNIVWASLVKHNVPSDFRGIPGKSCGTIIAKAEELGNCRVL